MNPSSGDSVGASPGESQIAYTAAVQDQQPILALNHETKGETAFLSCAAIIIMTDIIMPRNDCVRLNPVPPRLYTMISHHIHRREVLPAAIRTLKDAGYRLVSVAECTGREPYLNVDASALPPVSSSYYSLSFFC